MSSVRLLSQDNFLSDKVHRLTEMAGLSFELLSPGQAIGRQPQAEELLIYDCNCITEGDLKDLDLTIKSARGPVLLISNWSDSENIELLSRYTQLNHIICYDHKNFESEIQSFLGWYAARQVYDESSLALTEHRRLQLTSTKQLKQCYDKVDEVLANLKVFKEFRAIVQMMASELLLNSFFNAPRDAQGNALYAHMDRREEITLEPEKPVDFQVAIENKHLVMICSDPFGSLTRERTLYCLRRNTKNETTTVSYESGGAGLGLFMCFRNSSEIVFDLHAAKMTRIICKVPVVSRFLLFDQEQASIHILENRQAELA